MVEWWASLTGMNQWFFIAAIFFSVFLAWQLIAALIGLGGDGGADVTSQVDAGVDHSALDQTANIDAHESVAAFKLLSIRSVLAFFTLFSWAGALYLQGGASLTPALVYAALWGVAAGLIVAGIFYLMQRLTESGNPRLGSCLDTSGTVYLDIPAGGTGEVRVTVSGVMTHIRAKAADGVPLPAGTKIRVTRILDPVTIEVKKDDSAA
ncbi:MAG: hypothetical protein ACE15C_02755 [Phycisphaerae bacterium]